MPLHEIIWKTAIVEKLAVKYGVATDEVEAVLFGRSLIRFWEKGRVQGEDLYLAYGQSEAGRNWWFSSFARRAGWRCLFLPVT